MKKILMILCALTAIWISSNVYDSHIELQQNTIITPSFYFSYQKHYGSVNFVAENIGDKELHQLVLFAKKHHLALLTSDQQDLLDRRQKYITYLYDGSQTDFYLYNARAEKRSFQQIDFLFLSTHAKKAVHQFDLIDQSLSKDYNDIYEYRSFKALENVVKKSPTTRMFYIYSSNPEQAAQLLKKQYASFIDTDSMIVESHQDYTDNKNQYNFLVTTCLMLCVLTVFVGFILKQRKEICIRKLMGQSDWFIFRHVFLSPFILMYSLFTLSLFVTTIVRDWGWRKILIPMEIQLLGVLAFFTCLMVLNIVIALIFIHQTGQAIALKKRESITRMVDMSMLFKLACILLLLSPLVSTLAKGYEAMNNLMV